MRLLLALIALCATAFPQGDAGETVRKIKDLIQEERYADALAGATQALLAKPNSVVLLDQRALAIRGIARDLQRAEGYTAAVRYLEQNLTHWKLAEAFGETCLWSGREEHGLATLRACNLTLMARIVPELTLLARLHRYDEVIARANEAKQSMDWKALDRWVVYGKREAELRANLNGQKERARAVASIRARG